MITSLLLAVFAVPQFHSQNVGINTSQPDGSAILQVSSNTLPNQETTAKRGFLPPRVALLSSIDATTIPTPATGLLVYNTANAGTYPNEVSANGYYFWDGKRWEKIVTLSTVEEAVKPRILYIESNVEQLFTSDDINDTTTDPNITANRKNNVVTFESTTINTGNIMTFDAATSTFTANISGIYEFSAFVNYNPDNRLNATSPTDPKNNRAFLNLKIQLSPKGSSTWNDTIGSRTSWAEDGANKLKTALLLGTPLTLNTGDKIRLVIANPFISSANNDHCGDGNCKIANNIAENIPVAKGLRIQLLDYNIK